MPSPWAFFSKSGQGGFVNLATRGETLLVAADVERHDTPVIKYLEIDSTQLSLVPVASVADAGADSQ